MWKRRPVGMMPMFLIALACLGLLSPTALLAKGDGYKEAVRLIEARYHARGTSIPLVATLAMQIMTPDGVGPVRVTTFEQLDLSVDPGDLDDALRKALGQDWQPFIQVRSRSRGEQTYMYLKEKKQGVLQLLIVSLEPQDSTVVELAVTPETMKKQLEQLEHDRDGESDREG